MRMFVHPKERITGWFDESPTAEQKAAGRSIFRPGKIGGKKTRTMPSVDLVFPIMAGVSTM